MRLYLYLAEFFVLYECRYAFYALFSEYVTWLIDLLVILFMISKCELKGPESKTLQ